MSWTDIWNACHCEEAAEQIIQSEGAGQQTVETAIESCKKASRHWRYDFSRSYLLKLSICI